MSRRTKSNRVPWMVLLIMMLSACAPALPDATPAAEMQQPQATDTPLSLLPAADATEAGQPTEAPTLIPVKTNLEATDPATVELASGGPLLVEFFAFW